MPRIAVLGSLHLDVLVYGPDRPRKGETLAGHRWDLRAGGKGGNQAAQAARQGAEVVMIGRIGRDDFGEKLKQALTDAGVNTQHVRVDETASSGMSVAIFDKDGDYGALIVSGVNMHIGLEDIQLAAETLKNSDCLILQYEVPLDTVKAAAAFAREYDVRVILNAAPAYPAPEGLLDLIDVLVVNEIEAEMISGQSVDSVKAAEQAVIKLVNYVPAVLITLGGNGVMVAVRDGEVVHLPGYRVPLADTHGAGDAFIGALALRLAEGDSLLAAAQYANATGALTVQHAGPQADIRPEAVRAFMAEMNTG